MISIFLPSTHLDGAPVANANGPEFTLRAVHNMTGGEGPSKKEFLVMATVHQFSTSYQPWDPSLHPDHKRDLEKSGLTSTTVKLLDIHSVNPRDFDRHIGTQHVDV